MTTLTDNESTKVRLAFAQMPYDVRGAVRGRVDDMQVGSYRDPLTVDDVLEALDALREQVNTDYREAERVRVEFGRLQDDVAALRRVLGTTAS